MKATNEDGMRTAYHEEGGKIIVSYEQDIEAVLKACHEERQARSVFDKKGDMHKVMTVPRVVIMKICEQTGLNFFDSNDAKEIMKILRRPEFAAFRVYPGKI
jgi:hypothetical protein